MRHLVSVILAIVMAAAVFFAASWGYLKLLTGSGRFGTLPAGGGSLLQGLEERMRHETQMPAHLAESPLTCVAVGSGRSLEEFEAIHRSSKNSRNRRRRY